MTSLTTRGPTLKLEISNDLSHKRPTKVDLYENNFCAKLFTQLSLHSYVVISNHDLSTHLLNEIYATWANFFSSPIKNNWLRTDEYDEGYVSFGIEKQKKNDVPDYKEFYQFHYQSQFIPSICNGATCQLMEELVKLTEKLMFSIQAALPNEISSQMSMPLPEMISGNFQHMLRIIHYPAVPKGIKVARAAEHGDICLFTMLPASSAQGLEFISQNGEWFPMDIDKTDIILFNSDMIELCTNGFLSSATHRVSSNTVAHPLTSRYTLAFFIHPNRNVILRGNRTAYCCLKERLNEIGYDGTKLINTDKKAE